MRKTISSFVVLLALVLCTFAGTSYAEPDLFVMPEGAVYEPSVVLASVGDGVDAAQVVMAVSEAEGVLPDELGVEEVAEGVLRMKLPAGVAIEDAINDLLSSGVVLDAQPNYRYLVTDVAADMDNADDAAGAQGEGLALVGADDGAEAGALEAAAVSVNDPGVGAQWGLSSIKAYDAWSIAKSDRKVTVAVLDLGCDTSHPDLKDNIVAPYNAHGAAYGGSTSDVSPVSINKFHGTHVAGIIGAVANNGIGVAGVSYNARIMPIKVVDETGSAYTDTLVKAYDYLMGKKSEYNVRVVNLSMAAAGVARGDDAFLRKVDEAYNKGIVTVACAGNASASGGNGFPYDCYPSDYEKIVSVINLRQSGGTVVKSDQSNYNKPDERDKNISAPGTIIYSTVPGGDYANMSGTSMATPLVSGVLALVFAANPNLSVADAVDILYRTATDLGDPGWDALYGWGEVNALAAVKAAQEGVVPQPRSSWVRLAGSNRYDTMAAVVAEGFSSCTWAVVATGTNYPDALSASALAGVKKCPVIITAPQGLSDQARVQLSRLKVSNVYLMGGTNAISSQVENDLKGMGIAVTRIAGSSRMATSLKAYEETRASGSKSNTVIVATGVGFADSLSIGPWAYHSGSPIVLTQSNGTLSSEAVAAIKADSKVSRVIIAGGTNAVRDEVKTQLGDKYTYVRLSGENRYATSRAIAEWETGQGLGWQRPAAATGSNFPDALTGAALCGRKGSVLVLVSSPSDTTVKLVQSHAADIAAGYLLGGENVLSGSLAAALAQ